MKSGQAMGLMLWVVVCMAAGFIGSRFPPGAWYESLSKPEWNPPNWIFAPVWTTLYVMMAVAAWQVWRNVGFSGARYALSLFMVQLALNALWSYLFFGLNSPALAFLEIMILWTVILIVLLLFWRINTTAGALMVPYLAWVSFATYLNFVLWQLNQMPRS